MRTRAGGGSDDLSRPVRGGPLLLRGAAEATYRLLRRNSAGDGSHPARDRPGDADVGGGHLWIGLSRCELCQLGTNWRGADRLCWPRATTECRSVYSRSGRPSRGSIASVVLRIEIMSKLGREDAPNLQFVALLQNIQPDRSVEERVDPATFESEC